MSYEEALSEAKRQEAQELVVSYGLENRSALARTFNSAIESCAELVTPAQSYEVVFKVDKLGRIQKVFHLGNPFTTCLANDTSSWQLAAPPRAGIMLRISADVDRQKPSQLLDAFIEDGSL